MDAAVVVYKNIRQTSSRPVPSILWNGHKNNLLPLNCAQPTTPIPMSGDEPQQQ
jgi:hypothetical protein